MPHNKPTVALYALAYPVTALGPGSRAVLWVSGCGRGCPGCISPEMQDPAAGRPIIAERLATRLLKLDEHLHGITISGGEPFDQAAALSAMLKTVQSERPHWSVIIYTGYEIEEIRRDACRVALLEHADLVIDGAYMRDVPAMHGLAGSGNQRFHYLTPLGLGMQAAVEGFPTLSVNVGISRGELNIIIGVTERSQRRAIRRALFPMCDEEDGEEIC